MELGFKAKMTGLQGVFTFLSNLTLPTSYGSLQTLISLLDLWLLEVKIHYLIHLFTLQYKPKALHFVGCSVNIIHQSNQCWFFSQKLKHKWSCLQKAGYPETLQVIWYIARKTKRLTQGLLSNSSFHSLPLHNTAFSIKWQGHS